MVDISGILLTRFQANHKNFSLRLVTQETWINHFKPESNRKTLKFIIPKKAAFIEMVIASVLEILKAYSSETTEKCEKIFTESTINQNRNNWIN